MHAQQIAETAANIARSCSLKLPDPAVINEADLNVYWTAAKCRVDRWQRRLQSAGKSGPVTPLAINESPTANVDISGWIEEVFASEVLARICTAIGCGLDCVHGEQHLGPIVRSVYNGHLEMRRLSLHICLQGRWLDENELHRLDGLRRACERWTDILLGFLHAQFDVTEFAFDTERLLDFSAGRQQELEMASNYFTWPLFMSSIRGAFDRFSSGCLPSFDLNAQVEAKALSLFGRVDGGPVKQYDSPWLHRMMSMADETSELISRLVEDDNRTNL